MILMFTFSFRNYISSFRNYSSPYTYYFRKKSLNHTCIGVSNRVYNKNTLTNFSYSNPLKVESIEKKRRLFLKKKDLRFFCRCEQSNVAPPVSLSEPRENPLQFELALVFFKESVFNDFKAIVENSSSPNLKANTSEDIEPIFERNFSLIAQTGVSENFLQPGALDDVSPFYITLCRIYLQPKASDNLRLYIDSKPVETRRAVKKDLLVINRDAILTIFNKIVKMYKTNDKTEVNHRDLWYISGEVAGFTFSLPLTDKFGLRTVEDWDRMVQLFALKSNFSVNRRDLIENEGISMVFFAKKRKACLEIVPVYEMRDGNALLSGVCVKVTLKEEFADRLFLEIQREASGSCEDLAVSLRHCCAKAFLWLVNLIPKADPEAELIPETLQASSFLSTLIESISNEGEKT